MTSPSISVNDAELKLKDLIQTWKALQLAKILCPVVETIQVDDDEVMFTFQGKPSLRYSKWEFRPGTETRKSFEVLEDIPFNGTFIFTF